MVRPRGGRSQPRYYYYKEAGENRLVKFLGEHDTPRHTKHTSKVNELCQQMVAHTALVDSILKSMKRKLEEIRELLRA